MPLAKHAYLPCGSELGVWHITESEDALVSRLQLNEEEYAWLQNITHNKRHLHWLGSRVLIRWMLQTDHFIELKAEANKKPVLTNFPHRLSISHSGDVAAVLLSRDCEVGVDVEHIHPKILRVEPRFLSDEERKQLPETEEKRILRLLQYWCAKEALFKVYANGHVDFRKELRIAPGENNDTLVGHILKKGWEKPIVVSTIQLRGYMIAYAIANP